MGGFKDLTGLTFNKLYVNKYIRKDNRGRSIYLVQCVCGSSPFEIRSDALTTGHTKSCGCLGNGAEPKEITYDIDTITNCWNCTSHVPDSYGYPRATYTGEFGTIARRILKTKYPNMYIDSSIVARHTCDNRNCINPAHIIYGTNIDNVNDRLNRNRSNPVFGEHHHGAKLTEVQILEIRSLSHNNQADIATRYNVVQQTISDIQLGRSWKHVCSENLYIVCEWSSDEELLAQGYIRDFK